MGKFLKLAALFSLFFVVSCDQEKNRGDEVVPPVEENLFQFELEASYSTITAQVTPNETLEEDVTYYYFDLCTRETYDNRVSEEEFLQTRMDWLLGMLEEYVNAGYNYALEDFLSSGTDRYVFTSLLEESDYVLYAFVVDVETQTADHLEVAEVRTKKFEVTDACTFTIAFENVEHQSFNVKVTPSANDTRYYVGLLERAVFEQNSLAQIADALIAMENDLEIDWSGDQYIYTGERSLNTVTDLAYEALAPETEYAAVVFGVSELGERTTEVYYDFQATTSVPATGLTFTFENKELVSNGAIVTIIPSDENKTYFAEMLEKEMFDEYGSAQVAAEDLIGMYEMMGYLEYVLLKGTSDLDMSEMCEPSSEYVVIACGYEGGISSEIFSHWLTTPAEGATAAAPHAGKGAKSTAWMGPQATGFKLSARK